jgi:quercetin dioxygenase-like cupin family protein
MINRKIVHTRSTPFGEYAWQPDRKDITFFALSYDHQHQQGSYIMRMEPGAETELHTHGFREEYIIIEGDLIDPDGTVLGPGC